MQSSRWILSVAAALALAGPVAAEELNMAPAPSASTDRPARGMSMEKVEASFGSPARRVPAVGQPPITRWEYPGFVVYFEHNLVIHTVGAV
jgi:hypothetical protein